MSPELKVGILGATGAVGQKLVALLSGHPWFRVVELAGSARSQGRTYGNAVNWREPTPRPEWASGIKMVKPDPFASAASGCALVFSALDASAAEEVEPAYVAAGIPVISNAKTFRMGRGVPLVVPEVNAHHLGLLSSREAGAGYVVTNPNCSTTGLVLALKPLSDAYTIQQVSVTSMQAVSGAGYPGIPVLDILGNVVPFIPGEEEKLETEPQKILGRLEGDDVRRASFSISAQANRVPVQDGHLLSISVEFDGTVRQEDAREALENFRSPVLGLGLPSAPERPVVVGGEPDFPQPRLHAGLGGGMSVIVGRIRPTPSGGVRFVALVHNTIRGAAGGAILNAELLRARGFLA